MRSAYKLESVLVILIPILAAMIGGSIIYGGFGSFMGFGNTEGLKEISVFQIYIACSLLAGVIAMIYRYLKSSYYWYAALILSLLYTIYLHREVLLQISIVKVFLPILAISMALTFCITRVFFTRSLIKFRLVLFAVISALGMALFMRLFHLVLSIPAEPGFLITRFVNSMYLFLFIGFGLSMGDLITTKAELRQAEESVLHDETEEEEDDDLEQDFDDDDEPVRRPRIPRRRR